MSLAIRLLFDSGGVVAVVGAAAAVDILVMICGTTQSSTEIQNQKSVIPDPAKE